MDSPKFRESLAYFRGHLNELLQKQGFRGSYVVVHGARLFGPFVTAGEGLRRARAEHLPRGEFVLQQVVEDGALTLPIVRLARG